ncbi:hypothetical protein F5Y19DRAFT_410299 [Xylariaceae sp. FL1651]|nr:hypothetical protein F5Y19DRAFT_410299 [Xylariaceae sp. FL1651]
MVFSSAINTIFHFLFPLLAFGPPGLIAQALFCKAPITTMLSKRWFRSSPRPFIHSFHAEQVAYSWMEPSDALNHTNKIYIVRRFYAFTYLIF